MRLLPRSLRGRLTLVFSAVAALLVSAFAWALVLLVHDAVWDPLDASLTEEASTLATFSNLPPDRLEQTIRTVGEEQDLGPGKFVRVVGPDHRVLGRFRRVPPAVAARRPAVVDQLRLATVGRGRDAHRVVWAPVPGGGWVVLGVRVESRDRLVRRARTLIVGAAVALTALLGTLAWAITSRAIADLTRLGAELETIEAGSLDRRLATRTTTEVDRVVNVLNRMLERLESALAHLQRFTADAAHELRTPLAALRAHLEASIARAATVEEHRAGLIDGLEQAERLQRLSEDLLTLSAVETGSVARGHPAEMVRFDALVRDVVQSLRPMAEEQNRSLLCEVPEPITVYGREPLLKRVVLNLVDNAFRHTPAGTPITVSLGARHTAAVLEVRDGGPGMRPADLVAMFERFRKGSASSGAGLGLALVREIVLRHGGRVTLSSNPEGGTTATVLLPLAPTASP
ncbi:MAG TPA: ATP-binding protein [Candidatus Binatia bacterium]|nr:ATP-binding protein [Candidatus Binatia bacterium]